MAGPVESRDAGLSDTMIGFLNGLSPERRETLRAVVRAGIEARIGEAPWVALDPPASATAPTEAPPPPPAPDADEPRREAAPASPAPARSERQNPDGAARPESARRAKARRAMGAGSRFFVSMSAVQPVTLHWRSPGRIASGKITVLDGDPGLGKSTLLCELAARITRGDPLPGGEREEPSGVLLLSAEDDLHDTIRPRLDAAGADPTRVVSLLTVPDGTKEGRPFVIPGDAWLLEELVTRLDVALIIIDPLVAYLDAGLNANSDQDVRRALAALKGVGERTGAAIVAVRHLNKSTGANPLYRGGGSIGIIGAARCGLLLAADPDDPERRILAATKGNLGRVPASLAFRLEEAAGSGVARVVWDGESPWTAARLLRAAEESDDEERAPGQLDVARRWLREALAAGPRPAKEVEREAGEAGIMPGTIVRARKAEGVVARKARGRHGAWTWALPEDPGKDEHPSGLANLANLASLAHLTPSEPAPEAGVVQDDGARDPWNRSDIPG